MRCRCLVTVDLADVGEHLHRGYVEGKNLVGKSRQVEIKQLPCLLLGLIACIDPHCLPDESEWDLVLDEEDIFHEGFDKMGGHNVFVKVKSVGFGDMEDSIQKL